MLANEDHTPLETPNLSADVLAHGHCLTKVVCNHSGIDVLCGFADPSMFHHAAGGRAFMNPVVGRYANRLPAGETRCRSGCKLHLTGAQSVCLHGGDSGFDTLPWTPLGRADSVLFPLDDADHPLPPPASSPDEPITEASSLHRLYSPAGADGFPCSLEVEALTVVLAPEKDDGVKTDVEGKPGRILGKVKVVLRAKIREDGDEDIPKGTPLNLTLHWGFRLDNCREKDVLNHRLWLGSDKLVELDEQGISTGKIEKINEGDELDFFSAGREGPHRTIGERFPKGGIDRNFLLNTPPTTIDPTRSTTSPRLPTIPQAILTGPPATTSSPQVSLRFTSNQASVQIYTASHLDSHGPARKTAHGGPEADKAPASSAGESTEQGAEAKGEGYDREGMVFLEFQAPVGAVLHCAREGTQQGDSELGRWMETRAKDERKVDVGEGKDGRSWEMDTVLRRGQIYENWTEVEIIELDG
ncbi:uncharacterized protein JCM10292_006064 [Rhodotorula paludigena]|uniref:uncharacterized protein n=1 Tax=Rhodotorula paludigena TaxID=86838 RepID=UPI0031748C97